ncbi:DUF2461 domain-containing protein [uncultured Aquimarina sp.]|uniref:DUF2461 domain-containing protein n=1 Tax=uncultured Aquimarina sp. TaxID=575652 RepID=UPI00261CFA66|nr:DUF2461 domain-containing protein [uncultured Aquimarina sp.]
MQYFTQDFVEFFKELEFNNHKEWFHANKKRYEASVKRPFEIFVGKMIQEIQKYDPTLQIDAKECILRINRDIRFSEDKSPYNLYYTAFVSKGGRKDKSVPGLFLRLSPIMVGVMGGCFGITKEQLFNLRTTISNNPKYFRKLIEEKEFVERFGEIKGRAIKRIPREWKEAYKIEPLIGNKQFYFVGEEPPSLITNESLIDKLMEYWKIMRPVNEYLTKAIQ